MNIDIICVGRLKKGAYYELFQNYAKRLQWKLNVFEVESKYKESKAVQDDEHRKIRALIDPESFLIILDERGNGLRSLDFAQTIQKLQNTGVQKIQFVIGGADGLTDDLRDNANLLLSFGQQTWPHMLARVMLLEQVYRAQQILSGHPYHRE